MTKNLAISFILEDDVEPGKIARNSSCQAVRELWEQLTHQPAEQYCFFVGTQDGPELPEAGNFVQLIDPEAPIATIFVKKLHKIHANLVGVPEVRVELHVTSEATAEQVSTQVRRHLRINDARRIRFRIGERIIESESRVLNEMHLEAKLEFDFELSIVTFPMTATSVSPVIDDDFFLYFLNLRFPEKVHEFAKNTSLSATRLFKSDEVRRITCFSSETGEVLVPKKFIKECENEESSQIDRYRIVIDYDVRKPLTVPLTELFADIPLTSDLAVCYESRMLILVDNRITGKQHTEYLWPSSPLAELLQDENVCLMIDGEQADPNQILWDSGLPDGANVVVTKLVTLQVVDSSGLPHKIITDLYQPGIELHQQVTQFEDGNTRFQVWFDGRCLSQESRSLAQLGVEDQSQVNLIFRSRCVEIKSEERCLATFCDVREGTSFQKFLTMVEEATSMKFPDDTSFHCACGRVFSSEGPLRCTFPLRCCEADPLSLQMRVPEEQHFSGKWLDCDFRLSRGAALDILQKLSRLAACEIAREGQELEKAMLHSLLTLEATAESIRAQPRLHLLLELSTDVVVPWNVRSTDAVSKALTQLGMRTDRTFADVAVRRTHCLNVRERPTWSFADFRIVTGQTLTAIYQKVDGEYDLLPYRNHLLRKFSQLENLNTCENVYTCIFFLIRKTYFLLFPCRCYVCDWLTLFI